MIKSLFRIILYVDNMETMVQFYRDVMGLTVKNPLEDDKYKDAFWVEFETGGCVLVLHGGGKGRLDKDTPKMNFLVDDIEAMRAHLIQNEVNMGEIFSPVPGSKVCNGTDPEGFPFSLDWHE